jgi:D-serine deaminase-like pyridoxal phosphate-dependent protein
VVALAAAAAREGSRVDVFVELDVGQQRAGVVTTREVVELARSVVDHHHLVLRGIHAYLGAAQHRRSPSERRDAIAAASAKAGEAKAALLAASLPCEIVTGAGTGTLAYEAASGVYDAIQPGSYVLMDADYAKNEPDPNVPSFAQALFLLSTVTSVRPREGRAALDVGLKAQSTDCGPAMPLFSGWAVKGVNDEHTVLARDGEGAMLHVGEKVRLVPGHVDPTVNLHDWFVVVQNDRVVEVWPIEARGAFY